ncbi:GAF domain-containing protein [Peribacillus cavernae]|uniref:histidine kinase n=1 Tax=Peribacillus cavernae TaxID=1674310 RepID=A0A433HP29_9BACI|nr:ATP-binding sensor histidine kinase [Peribacillus cavernae]MDQ0217450.1 putative ATPase/signal transduction histidine kinase [Peribacillus cavernae]RUQ30106.1 GAF domain-containing protein [Peribacillus cavernae]
MDDRIFLPGYKLINLETENETCLFYKAYSTVMNKMVLIKVLKTKDLTVHEAASAIHEFHVGAKLHADSILQPLTIVKHLNVPYLVFEYFQCVTLGELLASYQGNVIDSLTIAANLATALSLIHQQQVIHKNMNPENILINPKTFSIKITGFNHATSLKQENYPAHIGSNSIDGHLAYISPEQTGRMNRSLDYRTDLYSLGVTLYQLFTGILPFTSKDPIQLVHAHLAKTPQNPGDIRKDLPETVSAIIMKLLSKSPEYRYNSAFGVREDLLNCLNQLQAFGKVEAFLIGLKDKKIVFETARKLYGREDEINKIKSVFNLAAKGELGIVLIPGHSGIGKTALVNKIHKPLVREKGYFISGKFDQLQRQVPYAPILTAFQSLIRQIMTESPEQIQRWKALLEKELTGNTAVITSIIPELEWLLGEHSLDEVTSVDSQKRFLFTFQKFINVFASKEHPLVLFLDDLQWADVSSLEMIEYLLTQANSRYMMVIGAYRDNEVGVNHPFLKTIQKIREANVPVADIPLQNLQKETIHEWLQDSLLDNGEKVEQISVFMHRITQGNPFFMKQLLQSYYEDGHIVLHPDKDRWIVELTHITEKPVKENIVNFMVERILMLPEPTQQVLRLASCIGNLFDLKTLSIISEKNYKETAADLWAALEAGLILPNDVMYKWIYPDEESRLLENEPPAYTFLHDRVQQAVYSTMTKEEQELAHLTIGRLLVKFSDNIDDQLFTIVNHLNASRSHLTQQEILLLTEWNVSAGEKAKASAAFQESLKYFGTAYELAGANWKDSYHLTFRMMKGLGECQYLTSRFNDAENTFNNILLHSQSVYEKLAIYNLKITLYTHVHRVKEAVKSGIAGLELFGINLSENPGKATIIRELALVRIALYGKSKVDLYALPEMTDKDQKLILQTLINMNAPTYHVDQNLATLLMLRALRSTLKYGITEISALVFNNYSLILSAGFSDFKGSYEFGNLAIDLSERFGVVSIKGRVQFVYGSFVNHWRNSLSGNLAYLEKSQRYCLDSGNIHLAGANSSFIVITLFMKGTPIMDTLEGIKNQLQFINQIQYPISKGFLNELRQWLQFLSGANTVRTWEFEPVLDDDSAKIIHYTLRLQMAYLFYKKDYAKELLQSLAPLVNKRLTLVIAPEYYFYHALWLSRFYDDAVTDREKREIRKRLTQYTKKMKKWAELAPENYLHKYLLLKAEIARLNKDERSILPFYDESIHYAEKNGFLQDAAIINECAARHYAAKGYTKLANAYMAESYKTYRTWGANAKAQQLLEEKNSLIETEAVTGLLASQQETDSFFDINAALKATQSISKEIILEKLLNKLMHITMEYGGADRGFLLYTRDNQLVIGEHKSLDETEATVWKHRTIKGTGLISEKIVDYVETSKEVVVLDDAASIGMFTEDSYVISKKQRSLLCLPILHKGSLNGILYLENNKATHAFTEGKIKFLTFLSTQAAISIENAYLYEKLESKVVKRTAELKEANHHLEELNQKMERAEQSRRHFLSNISHDLRAPIASVKGYIEAISDGMINTEAQKDYYLTKSLDRINDLHLLIHDLFELSQLETGQISFSMDFIPVDRLAGYMYRKYEYDIAKSGLTFKFENQLDPANGVSPMVEIDLDRMEQVFSNLITNAIKHTKFGEICLTLAGSDNPEQAVISIRDTGSGIPAEELLLIFDRNYTKTSKYSTEAGHGLGLSICKEIITYHKGEIWAESEEGKGTSFYIRLPLIQYAEELV